jgi:hypothetical protein
MVKTHSGQYGKKKQFIIEHWDDIVALRKTRSLSEVSAIYGGYVSRALIHYYEKILTK